MIRKRHRLLDYWVRFFGANEFQENELKEFREEPIMGKALEALEELSQEPSARQLAEMREKARINRLIILSEERTAAIVEGKAKGKAEGEAETRKKLIRKVATSGMSAEKIDEEWKCDYYKAQPCYYTE